MSVLSEDWDPKEVDGGNWESSGDKNEEWPKQATSLTVQWWNNGDSGHDIFQFRKYYLKNSAVVAVFRLAGNR